MNTKSMLIAAGVAGVIMAILSVIPVINCLNCLCWAGIWGSGILAVLLYRTTNKAQPGLTVGQGILLGLLAGAVGAVLVSIWGGLSTLIFGSMSNAAFMDYLNQIPGATESLDASSRQMIDQFAATSGNIFFSTCCNFVIYPLFGMIGGLIGTGLIWKDNPPAAQPPAVQ